MRAAILVVVACLQLWTGRSAIGFNALAAAAIVVLAMNPASLFLAGPQLSFLAVATHDRLSAAPDAAANRRSARSADRGRRGRGSCAMRKLLRRASWRVWLTGALIWSISTPLVWKQYNLISPSALVSTFLMWLPMTLAMYSGLGTLLLRRIRAAGRAAAWTHLRPLLGDAGAIDCNGPRLAGELFLAGCAAGWWIGLFYVGLAMAVAFPALRPPRRWQIAFCGLWIAGALFMSVPTGQMLATIWRAAARLSLYCRGSWHWRPRGTAGWKNSALRLRPSRFAANGRSPDFQRALVAADFASGCSHCFARGCAIISMRFPASWSGFRVGAVYVSPVMFDSLPPAVKELRNSIERGRRSHSPDLWRSAIGRRRSNANRSLASAAQGRLWQRQCQQHCAGH